MKMETYVVLSRLILFMAIPGLISNAIAFLILNRNDMTSSNNYLLKGMFLLMYGGHGTYFAFCPNIFPKKRGGGPDFFIAFLCDNF